MRKFAFSASQRGQRHIGSPGSRQDVGGPRPAGTAVFRTAYGPHDQLSARIRADALRAAPDNAGPPPGLSPAVYANGDTGLIPSAARELPRSHAARGNEKRVTYPPTMQARRLRYVGRHLLRHPPTGRGSGRGDQKGNGEWLMNLLYLRTCLRSLSQSDFDPEEKR